MALRPSVTLDLDLTSLHSYILSPPYPLSNHRATNTSTFYFYFFLLRYNYSGGTKQSPLLDLAREEDYAVVIRECSGRWAGANECPSIDRSLADALRWEFYASALDKPISHRFGHL